jgi:hypothetical protein
MLARFGIAMFDFLTSCSVVVFFASPHLFLYRQLDFAAVIR